MSKALSSTTVSLAEAEDQREKFKEEGAQVRQQANTHKKISEQVKLNVAIAKKVNETNEDLTYRRTLSKIS